MREVLEKEGLDGLLVTSIKNVRYLTGFTGSSGFALITPKRGLFYTDFRYKEQAGEEVRGWEIGLEKRGRVETLKALFRKLGIKTLGFESSVTYGFYALLQGSSAELSPKSELIERLRMIKDAEEMAAIRTAVDRAEKAFLKILPRIKEGVTEKAISLRLEDALLKGGCRTMPFDIIVASGRHSSMPHAKPTDKKLEKGDFVIIDWGGEANGYFSDMTRTLLIHGPALSEKKRIYQTVLRAQKKAIETVREGGKTQAVDKAARDEISREGYGEFFGHSTGHGVGLDVHEYPHVSWKKGERIVRGMVFTVEPGIYIPGTGGVRIEDMVAVTDKGVVTLTGLSKGLAIIR
ncbi:MAG: aminopeptidase P family protein [Nitrospirales bacterium]|nr:aminopeptidase P family protein [Nitrospirales bacterium]